MSLPKPPFVLLTTFFRTPFFLLFTICFTLFLAIAPCDGALVVPNVYPACAYVHTLIASFTSSSHHFTPLLHTMDINFLQNRLLFAFFTNSCHPSIALALSIPLHTVSPSTITSDTYAPQTIGKLLFSFGHLYLERSLFLSPFLLCLYLITLVCWLYVHIRQ